MALEIPLKKTLSRLLATALSLAACNVLAVHVAPDGQGQALIFPYYTVRSVDGNAYNTYVSIVNRANDAKVLRVRFRENLNGRETAGFNLYLGPRDAWAGAVTPSSEGAPPAAGLLTVDNSCANPDFTPTLAGSSLKGLAFTNANYSGANADGLGEDRARSMEGYVEVIEMATLVGASAAAATPGANGVPADCATLRGGAPLQLAPPTGGLSGTLTLINVASGLDFTLDATALSNLTTQAFYRAPTDPYPDFNAAEVTGVGYVLASGKGYRSVWNTGLEAVNAALTRAYLENEFILDVGTQSATDFVVTLPTKRFHVTTPGAGTGPFINTVVQGSRAIYFTLGFRSREGLGAQLVPSCGFLCPADKVQADLQLPNAATVVGFRRGAQASGSAGTTDGLGSPTGWRVVLPTTAENGALSLGFVAGGMDSPPTMSYPAQTLRISDGFATNESVTIEGLPAIGFAVRTLRNGTLVCAGGGCQGNYGGAYPHSARYIQR